MKLKVLDAQRHHSALPTVQIPPNLPTNCVDIGLKSVLQISATTHASGLSHCCCKWHEGVKCSKGQNQVTSTRFMLNHCFDCSDLMTTSCFSQGERHTQAAHKSAFIVLSSVTLHQGFVKSATPLFVLFFSLGQAQQSRRWSWVTERSSEESAKCGQTQQLATAVATKQASSVVSNAPGACRSFFQVTFSNSKRENVMLARLLVCALADMTDACKR